MTKIIQELKEILNNNQTQTIQDQNYNQDSLNLDKTSDNTIGSGYSTTQGVSQTKDLASMDQNERMQHLQDVSAEQRDAKQGTSLFEKTPLRKDRLRNANIV
eukprot:403375142